MEAIRRIREYQQSHGTGYTLRRLGQKAAQKYFRTYERRRQRELCTEEELERQRREQPDAGLISVVVPVYNTDPRMLEELIESLQEQSYRNYEVILYDGKSTRQETLEVLKKVDQDPFRVIHGKENLGISGNTNEAIRLARGNFVALCDHDDLVTKDALWRIAKRIAEKDPDMVYTDEDRISENGHHHMDPHYKPDYCPDNLISDNYICHLTAIRKSLLEGIGGLRSGFDGSQDHDLFLRVAGKTNRIEHVPYVLYSWREVFSSASHRNLQICLENGCRAVMEQEAARGRKVTAKPLKKEIRLWYEIPEKADLQAVIWGKSPEDCRACLAELREKTGKKELPAETAVIPEGGNRMKALNEAVHRATGTYLLILEAGVRDFRAGFAEELLMYAQREDAAGVSPALVDARGHIVHGGYAVGMKGIAQCVNEGMYLTAGGWHDMMNKVHNVIACSLGCMMIRKDHWLDLDEHFREGLGAVDQGLRQQQAGRWTVWTPHAIAVCGKSSFLLNGKERNEEDVKRFEEKWGKDLPDPCYSSRFRREKANYGY